MNQDFDYDVVKSQLAQRYYEILESAQLKTIYETAYHSGVFLPAPHESYFTAGKKVFIVGQETRGWRNKDCEAKSHQKMSIEGVISSMDKTLSYNLEKPKKSKFRQFYKSASSQLCGDSTDLENAALWSNQFCVSYKGRSTTKSPQLEAIQYLSNQLLKAQFEILKPDIVIFTTGHSRDKYLKQCFTCETVLIHKPERLWEFMVGDTRCFRTNHPSWGGSHYYLREAVNKAKNAR